MTRRRTIVTYGAAIIGLPALSLGVGWWQVDGPGADDPAGTRPLPLTSMDFQLTDHQGNAVGPGSLADRASLVFFGFTFCPDVCPTTLSDISGWLDDLEQDAERLNVVFITVDPERDTVAAMAEYLGYFHPAIRGWTGTPDQIARTAQDFRVTYEKVATKNGDYTMNHTSGVFLFDRAGQFVSTIDYHEPREFAVPKIRRALNGAEGGTT